jgi:hypothetical protein
MIFAQTLRVCREGKPVSTFPDHALGRFLDADDKAFSERAQRFYHRREFRRVLRIENTADFLFILPHPPAEFALSDLRRREGLQDRKLAATPGATATGAKPLPLARAFGSDSPRSG